MFWSKVGHRRVRMGTGMKARHVTGRHRALPPGSRHAQPTRPNASPKLALGFTDE